MRFFTEGMFGKFGLSDGDLLDDLVYDHLTPDEYQEFDDKRLLFDVVTARVLPHVTPDFTDRAVFVSTTHNPVRLAHDLDDDAVIAAPEMVEVDDAIIIAMIQARRIATSEPR